LLELFCAVLCMTVVHNDTHTHTHTQMSTDALVMVALWNRANHYIFILWFISIFYLSIYLLFFLA